MQSASEIGLERERERLCIRILKGSICAQNENYNIIIIIIIIKHYDTCRYCEKSSSYAPPINRILLLFFFACLC